MNRTAKGKFKSTDEKEAYLTKHFTEWGQSVDAQYDGLMNDKRFEHLSQMMIDSIAMQVMFYGPEAKPKSPIILRVPTQSSSKSMLNSKSSMSR